jgi:hypothetical protein
MRARFLAEVEWVEPVLKSSTFSNPSRAHSSGGVFVSSRSEAFVMGKRRRVLEIPGGEDADFFVCQTQRAASPVPLDTNLSVVKSADTSLGISWFDSNRRMHRTVEAIPQRSS